MTSVLPAEGSAYPPAVAELVPLARQLAGELGTRPSRNRLMREFRIGRDKANALLLALDEGTGQQPVPARDPWDFAEPATGVEPATTAPEPVVVGQTATTAPEPAPQVAVPVALAPRRVPVQGRMLAWTSLLVALGASVLANVAYARPELGPRLSAGTAPVLVVLAAGLLERVPLGRARWWQRWLAGGGLVFVVAAAFITSYQHQSALLREYGNPALSAILLPLAIDALICMSSVCLAVLAERRREES